MSRLAELTRKVDEFFARVADRHGSDMQCATGCSDCCHVRLTITAVEAAAIRAHVAAWPSERRRTLAPAGVPGEPEIAGSDKTGRGPGGDPNAAPSGERCAALDAAGRCTIYEARPLVCRSHGVPIRLRHGSLPVVQACHRNFTRTTPDPDCILDQTTLSATLLAVDAAEAPVQPAPGEPGRRIDLGRLLADLAAI